MNTRFEVFASYNILQYLCDFIHVLIFVTVSKCRKSPKLTNIVMKYNPCSFVSNKKKTRKARGSSYNKKESYLQISQPMPGPADEVRHS
jgi:hypothetical protein